MMLFWITRPWKVEIDVAEIVWPGHIKCLAKSPAKTAVFFAARSLVPRVVSFVGASQYVAGCEEAQNAERQGQQPATDGTHSWIVGRIVAPGNNRFGPGA
jgi:hypothetical protein